MNRASCSRNNEEVDDRPSVRYAYLASTDIREVCSSRHGIGNELHEYRRVAEPHILDSLNVGPRAFQHVPNEVENLCMLLHSQEVLVTPSVLVRHESVMHYWPCETR